MKTNKPSPAREAVAPKPRSRKKVFRVTETDLDAKAKGLMAKGPKRRSAKSGSVAAARAGKMHEPKPCSCAKSGDQAPEDKGHTKGRPGHYTYI